MNYGKAVARALYHNSASEIQQAKKAFNEQFGAYYDQYFQYKDKVFNTGVINEKMFYNIFDDILNNCEAFKTTVWTMYSQKAIKEWGNSIAKYYGLNFDDIYSGYKKDYLFSLAIGDNCIMLEDTPRDSKQIKIVKKGQDSTYSSTFTTPLQGIGFQVIQQNDDGTSYWINAVGDKSTTEVTLYTDRNGEILVENVLPNISYAIYEVAITENGRGQMNYGYVLDKPKFIQNVKVSNSTATNRCNCNCY